MTMAWRATLKMRRNFEQFFDVTIQPLLFTAMFAYIFGGAVSGDVSSYLPILIPGLIAQTVLTACVATGVQLREDMDKGVFDRFRVLPISRIAPLAGPMVADTHPLRDRGEAHLRDRHRHGLPPRRRLRRSVRRRRAGDHRRLVAGLGVHLVRHRRQERPGGAGLLTDGDVPADLPVQRLRPGQHPPGWLQAFVNVNPVSHVVSAVRALANEGQFTSEVGWSLLGFAIVIAIFAPLSVRSFKKKI